MAEGEGFEPPVPFRVQRFSRPPVSTAHASLRERGRNQCFLNYHRANRYSGRQFTGWSGRNVPEKFVVMTPISFNFAHDALKFRIMAQLVPVFVALEPREIMISELYRSSQPGEGELLFAQQRINRTNPFRRVAVNDFVGFVAKNCGINFVPFPA